MSRDSDPSSVGQTELYLPKQTASLFTTKEQRDYANLYNSFDNYTQAAAAEARSWGDLRTLERHPAPSATLDWQLRSAMQEARTARYNMDNMRFYALRNGAGIGVTPTQVTPDQERRTREGSACIPLHTPRDEAAKLLDAARGRHLPLP